MVRVGNAVAGSNVSSICGVFGLVFRDVQTLTVGVAVNKDTKEHLYIGLLVIFWLGMLILYWPVALVFLVFAIIPIFNLRDREQKGEDKEGDRK